MSNEVMSRRRFLFGSASRGSESMNGTEHKVAGYADACDPIQGKLNPNCQSYFFNPIHQKSSIEFGGKRIPVYTLNLSNLSQVKSAEQLKNILNAIKRVLDTPKTGIVVEERILDKLAILAETFDMKNEVLQLKQQLHNNTSQLLLDKQRIDDEINHKTKIIKISTLAIFMSSSAALHTHSVRKGLLDIIQKEKIPKGTRRWLLRSAYHSMIILWFHRLLLSGSVMVELDSLYEAFRKLPNKKTEVGRQLEEQNNIPEQIIIIK